MDNICKEEPIKRQLSFQTTRLRINFDKGTYDPGASSLKIYCWYLVSMTIFRSGLIPFSVILVFLLRLFGAKIGKSVRIKPYIHIRYPWKLSVGDYSWLADCYIDNIEKITIGSNVCVSQHAMLQTGNHNYKTVTFNLITKPIILEDGVWISARAVVCPGVIAFSHAVLSVGAIAKQDLEAYYIYQGNPAEKVRKRL
jgi:putative colanic acid biosynthesis acetyltransferase WcaF